MLAVGIVVAWLSLGGGLGLAPDDPPSVSGPSGPSVPAPITPPGPAAPPIFAVAISAAALAILSRRPGSSPGDALGLRPPPEARVVFVPGHGNRHAEIVYRQMVENMGLDQEAARYFDYRLVTGHDDHQVAARLASAEATAWALNSYLAGVAAEGHPVYVVGFSKGGAALALLISWWDEGRPGPAGAVRGAALIDPPIASGSLGQLQSLGRFWGAIPDDGGYDPVSCSFMRFFCHDTRAHLGRASGVEVVAVRNPNAAVTNFSDAPAGLRIFDAGDDGPGPLEQVWRNPAALPGRISQAHNFPLQDPRVARCIVEEMWAPGSLPGGDATEHQVLLQAALTGAGQVLHSRSPGDPPGRSHEGHQDRHR